MSIQHLKSSRSFLPAIRRYSLAIVILCLSAAGHAFAAPANAPEAQGLKPILDYISTAWDTLTRSMTDCASVVDPKIKAVPVLYLPKDLAEPPAVQKLATDCGVRVEHLPVEIHSLGEIDTSKIQPHGLLYLEDKYVVPGGRFNEMYGWDSYFIIRGLIQAGRLDLAWGMVNNFLFEIEHYGAMLNANRTYYLTRSQPPFVSSMFMDVMLASPRDKPNVRYLERVYNDLSKDYEMWTSEPHLAGKTGLSRYYDFGEGPPAEAAQDEAGIYRRVAGYFFFHPEEADGYIVELTPEPKEPVAGAAYTMDVCDAVQAMARPECEKARTFKLSADYYKGDRSMRESGFDVSSRFGAFGSATHHFAPVCLNSLLYKNEKDMEQIARWMGRSADAAKWAQRAARRKQRMTQYLWDAKNGMFFDYDFTKGKRSTYRYASMFYPLWAGLATPEQAKATMANLKSLERAGGIAMSSYDTGAQWDLPYGWGNIEMICIAGMRRYGFNADADRVSYAFLSTVAENFRRDGIIKEKYNVVTRSSEAHVDLGYNINVVGFGWTNAAFLELLHGLPKQMAERLEKEQNEPLPHP